METGERIRLEGKFTLSFLQKMVGGYIEILATKSKEQMIVNEEACIHEKALMNVQASEAYGSNILGDVVILEIGSELE